MQAWHYYVALGLSLALGNVFWVFVRKSTGFENNSNLRKFGLRVWCITVSMFLILGPYMVWQVTGFHSADAREAERIMVERYKGQGAQAAEVHFVVSGHSTMTGFAIVTLADGSVGTTQCRADKGFDGQEYLIICQ